MGIYISGVKGLPEQVQKNKDDIKDIQDNISEVVSDVEDLDERLTTAEGKITSLESKTSTLNQSATTLTVDSNLSVEGNIAFNNDDSGNIELNNETNGGNKIVSRQNSNHYIAFDSSDNLYIMSDGGEYEFSNDQILVNGLPIGGGSSIYQHNITYYSFGTNNFVGSINFYSNSSTPLSTKGDLCAYCYNNSVRPVVYGQVLYNSVWYSVVGASFASINNLTFRFYEGSGTLVRSESWSIAANISISDSVIQIS